MNLSFILGMAAGMFASSLISQRLLFKVRWFDAFAIATITAALFILMMGLVSWIWPNLIR